MSNEQARARDHIDADDDDSNCQQHTKALKMNSKTVADARSEGEKEDNSEEIKSQINSIIIPFVDDGDRCVCDIFLHYKEEESEEDAENWNLTRAHSSSFCSRRYKYFGRATQCNHSRHTKTSFSLRLRFFHLCFVRLLSKPQCDRFSLSLYCHQHLQRPSSTWSYHSTWHWH